METFVAAKEFVTNPVYQKKRAQYSEGLNIQTIDRPIVDIVLGFAEIPYCYTLQSCFGHFLCKNQNDENNITPLPASGSITSVLHRIAYIALCIEQSDSGRMLFDRLAEIPKLDSQYIQFGSAGWFWKDNVNTYALQVEPDRYKTRDWATVGYQEALHIEEIRNQFFIRLRAIVNQLIATESS